MRKIVLTALAGLMVMALFPHTVSAASDRTIMQELGLHVYPGARLLSEVDFPQGALLDQIKQELDPKLAVTDIKQVSAASFSISAGTQAADILKFYDDEFKGQNWTPIVRKVDSSGSAVYILTNNSIGMLIMNIDDSVSKDRSISVVRVTGKLDEQKLKRETPGPPQLQTFRHIVPGIPVGEPISVSPSQRLDLQSVQSDITARIVSGGGIQINRASGANKIGELSRMNSDCLLITLSPRLPIDSVDLPSDVPTTLELSGGSLKLSCSRVKTKALNVTASDASVAIGEFALVSGSHSIKAVGRPVTISLSSATGGRLSVEDQGENITLTLPKTASASVEITAASIQNQTDVKPQSSGNNSMSLKFGNGGASISVKAVNGSVTIKSE